MSEIKQEDSKTVIKLEQDLVAANVPQIKQEIQEIVQQGKPLTIDMTNVSIVDSKGIGLLIATYNSLQQSNLEMEVKNASGDIVNLFKSMRLDKRFQMS